LFFINTNTPNPAPDKRALMVEPKEREPFINIIVTVIEIAQFGINPIIEAIKHW
jgi:hypothetical protein